MQLHAVDITHSHGATVVLDRVSLTVSSGDRIGLVGPNGVGKSTLLRLLAGIEPPQSGRIWSSPPGLAAGMLPQELDVLRGETLRAYLERRTGVAGAAERMDRLAAELGERPELSQEYSDALEAFLARGGDDLETRAAAICDELGLGRQRLDQPLRSLSGGEGARARLAALLLSRFDMLLLDEPTNDLDLEGLERLERFLGQTPAGAVIVTHDRALLERHVETVVELDEFTRRATHCAGGWAEYQRERDTARRGAWEAFRAYDEERSRLEAAVVRRREWARQGAQRAKTRRTDNAKTRWDAEAQAAENFGSGASAIERRLARLDRVDKPREPWRLHIDLSGAPRAGQIVARLEDAVVERGGFRLGPVDLDLAWGERVVLTGRNGSGKSTLIAALLGELPLVAGERRIGPSVVTGSIDQARTALDRDEPLVAAFRRASRLLEEPARTLLAKYGLHAEHVARSPGSLSPGERSRAELALLSARNTNLIVLDEPTNHLDLAAIEPLEEALSSYAGTLLVVTHDRRFLERLEPDRVLALSNSSLTTSATR
jgi:ATPase subunit of ABC transporter with duplicated ATPase domains